MERVRVVRFDAGHGGCQIFSARGNLIRAQNSEFIGGYGKRPGMGSLFDGPPILARFSSCRFELLRLDLREVEDKGYVVFNRCTFALLREDPLEKEYPNVQFIDSIVESLLDPKANIEDLQKDLGDLFWQFKGK